MYSVNSVYRAISSIVSFLNKCFFKPFWDKITPLKVVAFCWKAILDRIPTKPNLLIRGVGGIGDNLVCPFCLSAQETTTHLFLFCRFYHCIWMHIYSWLGLKVVMSSDLRCHFSKHDGLAYNSQFRKHWRLLWFSTIWTLWLHQNDIVFNSGKLEFDKVIEMIKINSRSWCSAKASGNPFTFVDWCLNPKCCLESFYHK